MEEIQKKAFTTEIDADMFCYDCNMFPTEPKVCEYCQLNFCRICAKNQCINCNRTLVIGPLYIYKKLGVHCKNRRRGCKKILLMIEMKEHDRVCSYKTTEMQSLMEKEKGKFERENVAFLNEEVKM